MRNLVILTGPSGSGKTRRLLELEEQGFKTFDDVNNPQQISEALATDQDVAVAIVAGTGRGVSVTVEEMDYDG